MQRACTCGGTHGPTGECADCRRKRERGLQPKLRVNMPGDRYEREADQIADRVMRGAEPAPAPLSVTPLVQRSGGDGAATAPPTVDAVLSRPGRPLDGATQQAMKQRFGHDFSQVRVHTGAEAAASAEAVQARAYTVGRDVVFGAGQYRPGTAVGQRLLAHELVHTLQQGGPASGFVQRQVPSPDAPAGPLTPAQEAAQAEAACDMKTLCQLHFAYPNVVSKQRISAATLRCRPGVIHAGAPCFNPAVINPELFALPPTSGPSATPAPSSTPPAPASPTMPDLSGLTKFEFKAGAATFKVDLPSSATFNLPVELRNSYKITFELVAKASGAFSFSITLDGIPHIQIRSTTTADVDKKSVTSELMISSTLKKCQAPSPEATKAALQAAGDKLKTAIQNVNKSDAQLEAEQKAAEAKAKNPTLPAPSVPETPAEGFEKTKRLVDIVKGIVDVKKEVDKAQESCKPTAVFSFGVTGQSPFDPSAEGAVPSSITGGLKIEF